MAAGRQHMSDDGPRPCEAQSPETCTARRKDGQPMKHYDNPEVAQAAWEKENEEKYGNFPTMKCAAKNDPPYATEEEAKKAFEAQDNQASSKTKRAYEEEHPRPEPAPKMPVPTFRGKKGPHPGQLRRERAEREAAKTRPQETKEQYYERIKKQNSASVPTSTTPASSLGKVRTGDWKYATERDAQGKNRTLRHGKDSEGNTYVQEQKVLAVAPKHLSAAEEEKLWPQGAQGKRIESRTNPTTGEREIAYTTWVDVDDENLRSKYQD